MPIRRGEIWGHPGPLPADGVVVRTDAAARAEVAAARAAGRPVPPLGLLGGDLCRTVGGRGDETRLRSPEAQQLPVDLGVAVLDGGEPQVFVAHAVARHSWWRGRVVVAANAAFVGGRNLAPRAHPNDGRLDLLDGDLRTGDRLKAWRRLATATHVPHPGIAERRVRQVTLRFERPVPVRLDGDVVGRCRVLELVVEPDGLLVVV
jgi:hypothetical protein